MSSRRTPSRCIAQALRALLVMLAVGFVSGAIVATAAETPAAAPMIETMIEPIEPSDIVDQLDPDSEVVASEAATEPVTVPLVASSIGTNDSVVVREIAPAIPPPK